MSLIERPCIAQWTSYLGPAADGLHRLELLAEVDRAALGGAGGMLRLRGRLTCSPAAEPLRFELQQGSLRLEFQFGPEVIDLRLPDGSPQAVARDGAMFQCDGSLPGLTALFYAAFAETTSLAEQPLRLKLFLANTLATIPYDSWPSTDPAPSGAVWHHTSHRSRILLDAAGLMLAAEVPDAGFVITRLDPAPPKPDWPDPLTDLTPPPVYRLPEGRSFHLESVEIEGPVTPIGGALSIPHGVGPFPAVLFIGGSGVHDRHGITATFDIGSHEVMDDLAEHGFLGLRCDSRGAGATALGADSLDRGLTSDIDDARACLRYLAARPEAQGRPIFIIGHSQGATVALVLADEAKAPPHLHALVLMAAMGRDLDAVSADQIQAQGEQLGLSAAQIAALQADVRQAADLIRAGAEWDAVEVPHHLLANFRTATWLAEFLRYRPTELIARVGRPILLCQGEADFQVSPEQDAQRLLEAAQGAGRDCTYALFPGLDHLFKRSAGRSSLFEYAEPRRVAAEFLVRVRGWLAEQAGLRA